MAWLRAMGGSPKKKSTPWVALGVDSYRGENVSGGWCSYYGVVAPYQTAWDIWSYTNDFYNPVHMSVINTDGTFYLPTKNCKYLCVATFFMTGRTTVLTVYGMKKDDTTVYQVMKQNAISGRNRWVGSKDYNDICMFLNIDVSDYESIKIETTQPGGTNSMARLGLGHVEFYDEPKSYR